MNTIVDEKIKLNALSLYPQIFIKESQVNNYLTQISKSVNIENVEDLKIFFKQKEYNYEKFIKKIELELKWNQLIYQLNKNNIIIDKEKIDKKVEQIILNQKQEEYLISEIFIESSNMEELEIKSSEAIKNIEIDGFGNTAIKFSSSPSAMTGGKLGWVSKDEISDYLLNYIKKTDIGKVTERIYVSKGVIIFKIEDKRFVEKKIDIEKKISELVESEKNEQLMQFSSSFFNQVKNNIVIKYFNE